MGKELTIEEKAKELGLNEDNIASGLKSNKKEVTEAIESAYKFKKNKGKK